MHAASSVDLDQLVKGVILLSWPGKLCAVGPTCMRGLRMHLDRCVDGGHFANFAWAATCVRTKMHAASCMHLDRLVGGSHFASLA